MADSKIPRLIAQIASAKAEVDRWKQLLRGSEALDVAQKDQEEKA